MNTTTIQTDREAAADSAPDTDVLIVGAGPTGLMLANQLARYGVRSMIIDRHSGPAMQSRAMAIHARTLEIYRKLGIDDEAIALGRNGVGVNAWTEGRLSARIPFGDIGRGKSPFPFVLMLGQDDNEVIMGARLQEAGVEIQWNTELIALEENPNQVTALLRLPDGSERRVTARYIAGCDGGNSTVRNLKGIAFPGSAYEHEFFVADTEAVGAMVPAELNVYLWRDGFHLFFPMRGQDRWRVIGILPAPLRGRADVTFEMLAPSIRREAGANLEFRQCNWFSTYRIYHRCTERFRDRRCLLLGDAAHVHSPMGGQGMNTGLQDAYNLAWKLALVVRGRADERLLDSYETERMQVAQQLLRSTDRAFTLIVSDSRTAGFMRTRIVAKVVATAMKFSRARALAFRTLSQIGITYRDSDLSRNLPGSPSGGLRAGDRFPWLALRRSTDGPAEDLFDRMDDTRFKLLLFGQGVPADGVGAADNMVQVLTFPADGDNGVALQDAGIPSKAFYLVRPDGHVALAGTRFEEPALAAWFADMGIRV